MRLGFALPFADLAGGPLRPTTWADAARTAEQLGYSSVWTFDAVGRGFMLPDPLMALAAAGAATERLELATAIAIAFARNPMTLANLGYDLQLASGGRFILGLGTQIRPHIERRFSMPSSSRASCARRTSEPSG